jgi:hypothetical protein
MCASVFWRNFRFRQDGARAVRQSFDSWWRPSFFRPSGLVLGFHLRTHGLRPFDRLRAGCGLHFLRRFAAGRGTCGAEWVGSDIEHARPAFLIVAEGAGVLRLRGARFAYPAPLRMTPLSCLDELSALPDYVFRQCSRREIPRSRWCGRLPCGAPTGFLPLRFSPFRASQRDPAPGIR